MANIAVVLFVLAAFANVKGSRNIDCNTMDISGGGAPLALNTFPHQIVCKTRPGGELDFNVNAKTPFKSIIMQVMLDGRPIGTFRTRSGNQPNRNAVGKYYEVGCDNRRAQYSIDNTTPKTEVLGRWVNKDNVDLSKGRVQCVVTVIESSGRRWVKVAVPKDSQSAAPVVTKSQPKTVPPRRTTSRPAPAPQVVRTSTAPKAQPAPVAQTRNRGPITANGIRFPQHCLDGGRQRIPVPQSGCTDYATSSSSRVRAYHTCNVGLCFSSLHCSCRPCGSVTCPAASRGGNLRLSVYDNNNTERGKVSRDFDSSGGVNGAIATAMSLTGSMNPSNIPAVAQFQARTNTQQPANPGSSIVSQILSIVG